MFESSESHYKNHKDWVEEVKQEFVVKIKYTEECFAAQKVIQTEMGSLRDQLNQMMVDVDYRNR
jgi:hypothetical protein